MRYHEIRKPLFEGDHDGGDCYEISAKTVLDNPEYTLVHGIVTGQGRLQGVRYGHAWVEHEGNVIDLSNGRNLEFPKEVYYAIGNIDPNDQYQYNAKDLRKILQYEKHWGPWEEDMSPEHEQGF